MNSLTLLNNPLRQAVCSGLDIKKWSQSQVRYAVPGCTEGKVALESGMPPTKHDDAKCTTKYLSLKWTVSAILTIIISNGEATYLTNFPTVSSIYDIRCCTPSVSNI